MSFHVPNQYRIRSGQLGSEDSFGNNGAFFVPNRARGPRGLSIRDATSVPLRVIASDGLPDTGDVTDLAGWEHVSVSLPMRCPTWSEMAYIKSLFWDAQDCVVQFHPPESEYVNNHPFCLHMWRPLRLEIPLPPSILVGYRDIGTLQV